jgi:hypothetical protein
VIIVGSVVGTANASLTLPAHQSGDILIEVFSKDGVTPPATPGGMTLLQSNQNPGSFVGWKVLDGTQALSSNYGGHSSLSALVCVILRPDPGKSLSLYISAKSIDTTASDLPYPQLPLSAPSHVISAGAVRNADGDIVAPPNESILVNARTGASAQLAVFRSDGEVASWPATTTAVGGTASTRRVGFAVGILEAGTTPTPKRLLLASAL